MKFINIPNFGYKWKIGKYPVTQNEYLKIMNKNPSYFEGNLDRPVENVSWYDAMEFCEKLTERLYLLGRLPKGYRFRLPRYVEWKYACCAGDVEQFSKDKHDVDFSSIAWCRNNSDYVTHPVGMKEPNAWGIYDMLGNVCEFCLNPWGSNRVIMGGCYDSTFRSFDTTNWISPDRPNKNTGFRIVLAPESSITCKIKMLQIPGKNWRIGKYPITRKEYYEVIGIKPSFLFGGKDNLDAPVDKVSWYDAVAFCKKLTLRERLAGNLSEDYEFRLPTSKEWGYACRAGTTTKYCSGDTEADLDRVAWYKGNAGRSLHPVGMKAPNAWGIYDMHGNVWEWCLNAQGGISKDYSLARGGDIRSSAISCESSRGEEYSRDRHYSFLGFRVVLAPV